jgi:DNA primase
VKSQVSAIAAKYLTNVRPSGDKLRARCPFHKSSSSGRSFIIDQRSGGWFCYGCEERGFLPQLLRKLGLTRKQVDRVINDLKLPPPLPKKAGRAELNKTWDLLPEYILGAYETCPKLLLDKGFDMDLLESHDVGYDSKNDRITFAVRDYLGRLAAISGRARQNWVIPRYKVYDASPPDPSLTPPKRAGELFGVVTDYTPDNHRHLYGYHDVYPERYFSEGEQPPLVITEGYKSTLWMRQLQFTHTVGLQGSTLSQPQERLLGRLRGPYYVMLDNELGKMLPDRNGRCAALVIAKRLRRSGRVFLCMYADDAPLGTSPDDLTKEQANNQVQNAKTIGQLFTR